LPQGWVGENAIATVGPFDCVAHDEAVKRFAQDDIGFWAGGVGPEASADACGSTTTKATGKNNSRFLHCAPHDEAVRRFGRNDGWWVW
jgi:hypothetical protein